MATYAGNPSLASAVKERVTSTFQQALALYHQGRADEVVAGCNLILQMDPMFDPAKRLLQKTRDPNAAIDVNSLLPADGASSALEEARAALAARDFPRVVQITTEILTNDLMNDEARVLADEAREKIEAGPFIEQFAKKCEQHLAAGNTTAAKADLEKARALDPDSPTVARIEKMLNAGAAPSSSAFSFDASPSFVVDTPAAPSGRSTAQATDFGFTFEEDKGDAGGAFGGFSAEPASGGGFSFDSPGPAASSGGGFSFDAPSAPSAPAGGFSFDSKPAAPEPPSSGAFNFDSGTAPASDSPFGGGFSFDSPAAAGGGFSFDTPGAPKSPASGEFDFSSAGGVASADDQRKIEQYLEEGDREFTAGNYQQAIDLWSRIFLIDVTNDQASERIERAKGKRREIEQKVDDILAGGIHAFNRKDFDAARPRFSEVLRLDPDNATARDYMNRLASGAAAVPAAAAIEPPLPTVTEGKFDLFDEEVMEPSVEPFPPAEPARSTERKPAKTAAAPSRGLPKMAIAAVVVLLLAAGGWFAWSRLSAPDEDAATSQTVLAQASKLADARRYTEAIALLQEIKPEDPMHDKAVSMIADLQHRQAEASERIDGRPAAVFFQEQLAAGQTAFQAHDYDSAKKAFEQAMRVKPLPPEAKQLYDTAAQQVAKLDAAKGLFKERRYDDAITSLAPLLQQDPQNQNIQRMILDAHFNLGATALQEERLPDAVREFDEVLKVDPNDDLAKRSKELAVRYNGQPKDLLFKIYVKYLPMRQLA